MKVRIPGALMAHYQGSDTTRYSPSLSLKLSTATGVVDLTAQEADEFEEFASDTLDVARGTDHVLMDAAIEVMDRVERERQRIERDQQRASR